MSRTSKPKPQPQPKPDAAAEAAAQAAALAGNTKPESTLGDGDAKGAEVTPPQGSTAPDAFAPDVVTEESHGPEGWTVRVTGPAKGRWRAGRKFGPEEVAIPASDLTGAEFARLSADPELKVTITEDPA